MERGVGGREIGGRKEGEQWIERDEAGEIETGMKHRKKQGGGKSNPVAADRFLGEQCYLCLPLHTHANTHAAIHTQTLTPCNRES